MLKCTSNCEILNQDRNNCCVYHFIITCPLICIGKSRERERNDRKNRNSKSNFDFWYGSCLFFSAKVMVFSLIANCISNVIFKFYYVYIVYANKIHCREAIELSWSYILELLFYTLNLGLHVRVELTMNITCGWYIESRPFISNLSCKCAKGSVKSDCFYGSDKRR